MSSPRKPSVRSLAFVLLSVVLLAVGCDQDSTELPALDPPTFVGKIEGSDALVAVSLNKEAILAYTCGGGSSWQTHTGWYFGEIPAPDPSQLPTTPKGALPALKSAAGHTLEASVDGNVLRGTITLPNGKKHAVTAERARSGAGLFARQNDESTLVGLIVTNDGKMAGTAKISTGGTTTSSPVSVGGSGSTTTPTGTPTPTVSVSFPVPTTTTIVQTTVTQVLTPQRLVVTSTSPMLIMLQHGMTPSAVFDGLVVNGVPAHGSPQWARLNSDSAFVQGLLGDPAPGKSILFNLLGHDLTGEKYFTQDIEPCERAPTSDCWAQHVMTNEPPPTTSTAPLLATSPIVYRAPPRVSVFAAYRNGELGLVAQAKEAVNQLHAALTWYEDHYNLTPKVVLIAHSYGGLVSRFVLSNPTAAQVAAPGINADNLPWTDLERSKADYVRDRTAFLVTVASPHEGSRFINAVEPIRSAINDAASDRRTTDVANALLDLVDVSPLIAPLVRLPGITRAEVLAKIDALRTITTIGGVRDLTTAYLRLANRALMPPSQMVRSNATPYPGASGKLVPLYSVGGRSAGGTVFDTVDVATVARDLGSQTTSLGRTRNRDWVIGTLVSDTVAKLGSGGWGNASVAGVAFAPTLDKRRRLKTIDAIRAAAVPVVDQVALPFRWAFGSGTDAIVSYIVKVIYKLDAPFALTLPAYVATEPVIDLSGSFTVDAFPRIRCSSDNTVVDLPAGFVDAMLGKYQSGAAAFAALKGLDWNAAVAAVQDVFNLNALVDLIKCVPKLEFGPVTVPAPRLFDGPRAAADGEIDSDGAVGFDSAMGLFLGGSVAEPFDHRRTDTIVAGVAQSGPWYRLYDTPFSFFHHPMHVVHGNGLWLSQNVLSAGPIAGPGALSTWQ